MKPADAHFDTIPVIPYLIIQMQRLSSLLLLVASIAVISTTPTHAANGAEAPPLPDFTQGGKPGQAHDWTLGPTGVRGWIYTANGHSRDARQILITAVAKDSPADGVLNIGDVILGVGSQNFGEDARI